MVGDGGGVPPKKGFVGACLPRPGDTELLGGGRRPQLSPLPAPALGRGKGAARPHRVPPSKCPEILRGVPHHGPTKSLGFGWVGGGWRCCPPKKTCTPHIALGTPKLAHSVPMHGGPNASTHCDTPPLRIWCPPNSFWAPRATLRPFAVFVGPTIMPGLQQAWGLQSGSQSAQCPQYSFAPVAPHPHGQSTGGWVWGRHRECWGQWGLDWEVPGQDLGQYWEPLGDTGDGVGVVQVVTGHTGRAWVCR